MFEGITKKMKGLSAKRVTYKQASKWVPAVVNHLYKVVQDSDYGSSLRRYWWKSAANHICNIHDHEYEDFPACLHGPLEEERVDDDGKTYVRDWIDPGELPVTCLLH